MTIPMISVTQTHVKYCTIDILLKVSLHSFHAFPTRSQNSWGRYGSSFSIIPYQCHMIGKLIPRNRDNPCQIKQRVRVCACFCKFNDFLVKSWCGDVSFFPEKLLFDYYFGSVNKTKQFIWQGHRMWRWRAPLPDLVFRWQRILCFCQPLLGDGVQRG